MSRMLCLLNSLLALFITNIHAFGHCDVQYGYEVISYDPLLNNTNLATSPNFVPVSVGSQFYKSKAVICLPQECGDGLQISSWMQVSVAQPNAEDPQYGFAQLGFNGFDGFQFSFWITNLKVYALYARFPQGQTPLEYYLSAVYLIPIADRTPGQTDLYELWLDPFSRLVSWRMNNYQLLRIKPTGLAEIDSRFMVADYGGYFPYAGFPENGQVIIGYGGPDGSWYTGNPHSACLGTLFNQCLDSLSNAKGSECIYDPLITPAPIRAVTVTYTDLSVTMRRQIATCPMWTCEERENVNCSAPPVNGTCVAEEQVEPMRLLWQRRPKQPAKFRPRR